MTSSITGKQAVLNRLAGLSTSLSPVLRKMMGAVVKVVRPKLAAAMPRAKRPRKIKGVTVNPGLTQGAVGSHIWVEKDDNTTRAKIGLNVDRERAPSMTGGIPGKHKSYYGPWNILGTQPRYTGSKTRRAKVDGVKTVRKISTGNTVRYTGQLSPKNVMDGVRASTRQPGQQAAKAELDRAMKDL